MKTLQVQISRHHFAKSSFLCLTILTALFLTIGVQGAEKAGVASGSSTNQTGRVREPAVAGLFYPAEKAELSQLIDRLLAAVPEEKAGNLKALVCPHAGYRYSGQTAAFAYKLLAGRSVETVILLAPSHYAAFRGASVSSAEWFRTPLGSVPISEKATELAKKAPFVLEPRCFVQRPDWSRQSSRSLPPAGEDTPDTWEHSDEVQVPFLQKTLGKFKLLPIVLGEVDPAEVARGLAPLLDEKTLLVASSDLSHYHAYDRAKALDARCVTAITNLDLAGMRDEEACGKAPILTIMNLARLKGWKARLLDYRNSGDSTGDKQGGVVGYAAVAFSEPDNQESQAAPAGYSREEKKFLLDLARRTVREVVTAGKLPEVEEKAVPARLTEKKGCFVTLTKKGQLRGCIGHIIAQEALYKAVMDNARSAAIHDYRFSRVEAPELAELEYEVSVLTDPQPLEFSSPEDLLQKLQPHKDGVVLRIGGRASTFLPQVWEQIPDKVEFLNHLAAKGGSGPSDWRQPGAAVSIYHVEAFKESDL
jgi:MEMO1 family protein